MTGMRTMGDRQNDGDKGMALKQKHAGWGWDNKHDQTSGKMRLTGQCHTTTPSPLSVGGQFVFSSVLVLPTCICVRAFLYVLYSNWLVNSSLSNITSRLCEGHLRQGSISVQIYFVGTL